MNEVEAALSARLGVIEMLLVMALVELAGPRDSANAKATLERVRTTLWNANPNLDDPSIKNNPSAMRAFRQEWERRIDLLFDDALLSLKPGNDQ
jgi:hypothetical protein